MNPIIILERLGKTSLAIRAKSQFSWKATRACLPKVWAGRWNARCVSRTELLTDAQWELIAPLMPSSQGRRGRPFADHRTVVEGIIYRYRTGIAWRDLPGCFGPWQTVWKRHRRFSGDGTWDKIHSVLLAHADAAGLIDWEVSVDSTINRAHQHATNLPRDTGGPDELHESAHRAA
ncbi:transposase [Microbacterium marinum]|jgi:putative transposase|uniref:Transposase n=4 Tax=Microbacterium TaxID=33882 RepID=A0A7W7FJS6_9MICO|nr:transposase [Microbacterium marinum]